MGGSKNAVDVHARFREYQRTRDPRGRRRAPSAAEVAEHLQLEDAAVLETQALVRAASPLSTEAPLGSEDQEEAVRVGDHLVDSEDALLDIETCLSLRAGVDALET